MKLYSNSYFCLFTWLEYIRSVKSHRRSQDIKCTKDEINYKNPPDST